MAKRIFIGSSSEAKRTVDLLKTEIEDVLGRGSVLPWDESFEQGVMTLAAIENLPNKVVGALILATPDVTCKRDGRKKSSEPVSNVVYEYGYLSARLSGLNDHRVAICRFDGAILPTDLAGLTTIMAGPYDKKNPPPLNDLAKRQLRSWLNQLAPLAEDIPPIRQVHGYTGTWDIETKFQKFRGVDVSKESVYFKGKMFLYLSADGKGTGRQKGVTSVNVGDYSTSFTTENELEATLDQQGTLTLKVRVLSSKRGPENGTTRDYSLLREELPGHGQFPVKLKPKSGEPLTLSGADDGGHDYSPGFVELQKAEREIYRYLHVHYPLSW